MNEEMLERIGEALRTALMVYEPSGRKRIAIYLLTMNELTEKP